MNKVVKIVAWLNQVKMKCALPGRGSVLSLFLFIMTIAFCPAREKMVVKYTDTSVSSAIAEQLLAHQKYFVYAKSVRRFYNQNGFKLVWVAPDTIKTLAPEAMMLLDCVLQYGLNYADYHPGELTYEKLNLLNTKFTGQSNTEKAAFDVLLTNALITYTNNLHYGKLNPEFPAKKIDVGSTGGFDAVAVLKDALKQNSAGFTSTVLNVQPRSKAYKKLQYEMYLVAGLYTGDCYEIPDTTIRKIAINMERLRWIGDEDKTGIIINIPSYTLSFCLPDTVYGFKVIVGRPNKPTPTLRSAISYFTIAGNWKVRSIYGGKGKYEEDHETNMLKAGKTVGKYYARQSSGFDNNFGRIVFRFPNIYDIYLQGAPGKRLFEKQERSFSHGSVTVEHAAKLVGLMLKNDRGGQKIGALHKAISAGRNKTFKLKTPVPLRIVYLTCEVREGILLVYNDIYNRDKNLERVLFNTAQPAVMK